MNIYMDNAATTAVRREVAEAMLPYLTEIYGNPSSIHTIGQMGKKALEKARTQIAELLGSEPREIYLTSGATESNNLAIKGFALANRERGRHLITSSIEHHAVLHVFKQLEKKGFEVTYLPVDRYGLVELVTLESAIREDTILISIILANNEIGTIEPIGEVAKLVHNYGIALHTDAVQAVGKLPVNIRELDVDMLSFTGHKIYGPKGVGALYKREGINIGPLFEGGHQERSLRPGTQNVPGAVGLASALILAAEEMSEKSEELIILRDHLEKGILLRLNNVTINGHPDQRVPGITSLNFAYIEGEALLLALDTKGIAVSTSSACSADSDEPSHVLTAIGLDQVTARGTLRFSLGRYNTREEMDYVIDAVVETVEQLRQFSPLKDPEEAVS